jgi:Xaa-Pro aminopeptidase
MRARRDALRANLPDAGVDALLVTHLPNVRYLTGFSGSSGTVLVAPEDVFFTDTRYEEQSAREVPDCRREIQHPGARMLPVVAEVVRSAGVRRLGIEAAHLSVASYRSLGEALGEEVALAETQGLVEALRRVKDPHEVKLLATAASFADAALERLLSQLREGATERDVAGVLEDEMRRAGSDGASFPSIVAFGESAAEPHHGPGDRRLRRGDVIKLDFGATHQGYHSDMTRTIAFGRPSDEAARVHELVRRAQAAGVEAVAAGVRAAAVDETTRVSLREAGYDFGHSTGHGIGLEVHEEPALRKDSTDVLVDGNAVTVEPGVYIPGAFGVRIEDTVIVRDGGCEIITKSPKELIVV